MAGTKSGKYWVTWANTHAKNSSKVDDLEFTFKPKVKAFIKALEDGGANITIKATNRHKKRAYLFHWCWKIYLGKCKPSAPPKLIGVDIQWDHGDLGKSKAGAKEMIDGFGLAIPPNSVYPPSITSKHIGGMAIDMDITWKGTIKVKKKDGTEVSVEFKSDTSKNTVLHAIGASYGVKKLINDKPHWSFDGK
ncbi:MAG: hypothetical protein COA42_15175 [Alteromonadaceae bacterium]|nr:MAG: hypothetical protein COA42_15175 [Alteromonadaceae bacterium]